MPTYKTRGPRYTKNEAMLIVALIKNRVDITLWNGDTIIVDQSENMLTDIRNEYGEELLRIFNHIEANRIAEQLEKLHE